MAHGPGDTVVDKEKDEFVELEMAGAHSHESNGSTKSPEQKEEDKRTNKLTFGFFMTMVGFSISFAVAEVVPLFFITLFTVVAYDLKASSKVIWLLASQIMAIGGIAPFVGTLSDLVGRKYITLIALALMIVSMIIIGTTPNITGMIVGQVVGGISIGIQLLTALAAVTELVPVFKRGITIGYVVCGFMPFAPAPVYGQLLAAHSWRWVALLVGIWSGLAFVLLAIWYHPPPRPNAEGLSKMQLIKRMDFIGAFLSITGLTLFLLGLNWGGIFYPWKSAHVITPIVLGLVFLIGFVVYEKFVAPHPMFPGTLVYRSPKAFVAICVLCITSGINYMPLVVFWTIQCYTVYYASFTQAGIWDLPIGFCIAGGAVMSAVLITVFRKRIPMVLMFFCILQTAGLGSMAAIDPDNISTAWAPLIFGLIGVGGVLLPSQVIFSILTPHDIIGAGVALSISIRTIGQVIGLTLFYNIFQHRLTEYAPNIIALPAIQVGFADIASITELVTTMAAGPLTRYAHLFPQITSASEIQILVKAGHDLYSKAFPEIYLIAIAFGGTAVIACAFLVDINRFVDDHVAVHLA